jgi:dimethylargininase
MIAITHLPSPDMSGCQLTHLTRVAIDHALADRQHAAYRDALQACGANVVALSVNGSLPDCTFVEDTAIVLDEVAVLTPMGTPARQSEPAGIEPELRKHREIVRIDPPAAIEGGDVLRVGRTLYVGTSGRTNPAGAAALAGLAWRYGYRVVPVPVHGCLHLKTAVTALPDDSLLINPAWVDADVFHGSEHITVPPEEPWAANVVCVGNAVIASSAHTRTIELIRNRGVAVRSVDLSEFAKAEGGVTCLSLLVPS